MIISDFLIPGTFMLFHYVVSNFLLTHFSVFRIFSPNSRSPVVADRSAPTKQCDAISCIIPFRIFRPNGAAHAFGWQALRCAYSFFRLREGP